MTETSPAAAAATAAAAAAAAAAVTDASAASSYLPMDYNKPALVSVACQIAKEQLQVFGFIAGIGLWFDDIHVCVAIYSVERYGGGLWRQRIQLHGYELSVVQKRSGIVASGFRLGWRGLPADGFHTQVFASVVAGKL